MQVNRITWRNLYDVKALNGDISYNGNAGAEILHYYLTRYVIPKKEDKQPGGHLAPSTYSAYNAGPGGVARYRSVRQSATWKKLGRRFLDKIPISQLRPGNGREKLLQQVSLHLIINYTWRGDSLRPNYFKRKFDLASSS